MKYIKYIIVCLMLVLVTASLSGCSSETMKDGFYTAEAKDYSHGWKEYICILVKSGKIVSVEYNAKDASGFIKAWDNEYMRTMNMIKGTYPSFYARYFGKQLLEDQNADSIDALSGATHSYGLFSKLAAAVVEQAKAGDTTTVIVDGEEEA